MSQAQTDGPSSFLRCLVDVVANQFDLLRFKPMERAHGGVELQARQADEKSLMFTTIHLFFLAKINFEFGSHFQLYLLVPR